MANVNASSTPSGPGGGPIPILPTALTLGNALCGLASVTFAMQAAPDTSGNQALLFAGLMIFAAMLFDMLDGGVARWTRQTSRFGAELDSLCDAISFGVAPAFLVLKLSGLENPLLLWMVAAAFMMCTVLRLARFNVETGEDDAHDSFSGLPSPAAAATVASFAIVAPNESVLLIPRSLRHFLPGDVVALPYVQAILPAMALVLAGLMVSRVRYPHLVNRALQRRPQVRQLASLLLLLLAIAALGKWTGPLLLCAFVLVSPLRAAWSRWHRPGRPPESPPRAVRGEAAGARFRWGGPQRKPRLRLPRPPRSPLRRRREKKQPHEAGA